MLHGVRPGDLRVPVDTQRPAPVDAARVWEDFHASLLRFITRRVRDRDSAEDILQDVMLRIHSHADDLDHPAAVAAWVHRIARNAIADHYRRAAIRHEHPAGIALGDEAPAVPEPDADAARKEIAACLRPLVEELPPLHREAVRLTELDGVSQVAAAGRLGMSTSGMKSRVQRGRAQLKDLLAACCEVNLDRRARIESYQPRGGPCGCQSPTPDASDGDVHRPCC
jgi:RNA polymerase sigma-70 factor, ECF subfamily